MSGKEVTPVLLAEFARYTAGASVEVNRRLVVANAGLAGRISRGDRQGTDVNARHVVVIGDVMLDVVVKPETVTRADQRHAVTRSTQSRWRRGEHGRGAGPVGTPRDVRRRLRR